MRWQGSIDFQKPIKIEGKPHGIEHEATLTSWVATDVGRLVHAEDTGKLWFATDAAWVEVATGEIPVNYDDRYYTETEIDGFFEGENGGKKQVDFTNITNKPSLYNPTIHSNTSHSETYIVAADVTFEVLQTNGDVGIGADQLAIGSHNHDTVYTPTVDLASTVDGKGASLIGIKAIPTITSTNVQGALEELQVDVSSITEVQSLDDAYNNGSTIAVDNTNIDFELSTDKSFNVTSSTDPTGFRLIMANQTGARVIQASSDTINLGAVTEIDVTSPVIGINGNIIPSTTASNLGSSTNKFGNVWAQDGHFDTASIYLGTSNAIKVVNGKIQISNDNISFYDIIEKNELESGSLNVPIDWSNVTNTPSFYTQTQIDSGFASVASLASLGDQSTSTATSGYQELGLSGITSTTNTGLIQGGTYYFDTTVDGILQSELNFTLATSTPAEYIGNVDLSSGHDWTNYNQSFTMNSGSNIISLDETTSTISEVQTMIEADLPSTVTISNDGSYLTLASTTTGSSGSFTIDAGGNGLTTLGFVSGTYTGVDGTSGYQEFGLNITDTDPSGLADNTEYHFKVNGIDYAITTSTSPTYSDVIGLMNAQLTGFTVSSIGGDIRITNDLTGITSTVNITSGASVAQPEVTDITAVADVSQSLSGKYFTLSSPTTDYYVWYSMEESAEVPAVAEQSTAQMLSATPGDYFGEYFTVYEGSNTYDIWFDTTGSDTDPTSGTNNPISVDISTATSVDDVAAAVGNIIITNLTISYSTDTVTFVADNAGAQANHIDGTNTTHVTTTTSVNGADTIPAVYSTDPAPSGTGLQVDIVENDSATDVTSKTITVIDGQTDFSAILNGSDIRVTNADDGDVNDATAGTSGFTININTQGTNITLLDLAINLTGFTTYDSAVTGVDATTATTTNSVDLSSGYDWMNYNESIIINGTNTINLDENTVNLASIIVMVNADLPTGLTASADVNFLKISTNNAGSSESFIITSGNGLTTVGWVTGTYSGTDGDGTTWSDILNKLNTVTTGATWIISGDDIRLVSNTTGSTSSILLSVATGIPDLFVSLTGFTAFDIPVDGVDNDTTTGSDMIGVGGMTGIVPTGKSDGDGATLQEMLQGIKAALDALEARIAALE